MSDQLLHCPFCGNQVEYYQGNYERYVRCEICLTQGPIAYTDQEAVEFWNRRPSLWRNFRTERPEDGQDHCWIAYEMANGITSEGVDHGWYYPESQCFKDSSGFRVYVRHCLWLMWQPYIEPTPPTPAEIRAAMEGK